MHRLLALVLVASLATGCTPATRKYLGAGIFVGGLATAGLAASELEPCVPNNGTPDAAPNHPCTQRPELARPKVGEPLLVGGLLIAFLGVALFATGFTDHRSESVRSTPPRPSEPFPLDLTAACALTGRYLHQAVSCSGPRLLVAGTYAELSDVHLRDGATLDEQRLNVCFEHRTEWVVADSTTESCGRAFDQAR